MADIAGEYVPKEVAKNYWAVLIETRPCACCGAPTVERLHPGPFPAYHKAQLEAQCERAGIHFVASARGYSERVCHVCAAAGVEKFTCALCKQERPLSQSHESIGYPSEHVCVPCYETVPAKAWDAAISKLEEEHRYDFE